MYTQHPHTLHKCIQVFLYAKLLVTYITCTENPQTPLSTHTCPPTNTSIHTLKHMDMGMYTDIDTRLTMNMPPHGYSSLPVCSCTCCEAPIQGHVHDYTIHTCALYNCGHLHRGPPTAHKISPTIQTPRHRCTHTIKMEHLPILQRGMWV